MKYEPPIVEVIVRPKRIEVVHRCPPRGSGLTPCCGRTPFELPRTDMLTLDPDRVTCRGAS